MERLWNKTNELIKKSFELWDIKDWSPEELDPVVKLLFAACANESIQLDKQIRESSFLTRESLINSFLPPFVYGPNPACAMIAATPVETKVKLNDGFTFEYEKARVANNKKEIYSVPFKPAYDATLLKAWQKYVFIADRLKIFPGQEIVYASQRAETNQSVWIGIKIDESIQTLDGLCLYFSIGHPELNKYKLSDFDLFDKFKCYCNDEEVHLIKPLDTQVFFQLPSYEMHQYSSQLFTFTELLSETVSRFSDFYFQVADANLPNISRYKKKYPEFFNELFDEKIIKQFKEELVWLEFRFEGIQPHILEKVNLFINSFPALNHRILSVDLDRENSIQKLSFSEKEDLIGVISYKVFDEFHNQITASQAAHQPFFVRDMAIEKYSKRDLFDLVEEMIDRFVTDNQAFQEEFRIEADVMNRLRDAMRPVIAAKQKIGKANTNGGIYALYNNFHRKEIASVVISCSITNGEDANGIMPGESLKSQNALINQTEVSFASKTSGGRNRLSQKEKASALKQFLLSGDKIITNSDLRNFCLEYLGSAANAVKIENGIYYATTEMRRCINVNILLKKDAVANDDLIILKKALENKIRNISSIVVPVKVNFTDNFD